MAESSMTLTIHMVASLDGIIAKKDNSVAWFDTPDIYEKGVTEENAEAFLRAIDCYIMGSKTYEHAMSLSEEYGWAYGETPVIVLTKRPLTDERKSIEFFSGDLNRLIQELVQPRFKNVWVAGGAEVGREFIIQGLADEIRLSIVPIILGEGTPFFGNIAQERPLHLRNVTAFKNGMVELWYEIKKD